ncbi:heme-binding protein [Caballeronia sp. LjRoot34]|uniref:heme-binding protein n=1 Tax=Caballeronia sp. LjRoot34 TaxID=3342325 RepID=UPI003ECC6304
MLTKPILTEAEVTRILEAARAEAQLNDWKVAIAVVDDGGHPLALLRLDGCAPIGSYIATEKARTAALGRRESKAYEEMINGGRTAFLSAPLSGTLEGGVPVIADGQVVGAVGVSGVQAAQDAQIAKAAAGAISGQTSRSHSSGWLNAPRR